MIKNMDYLIKHLRGHFIQITTMMTGNNNTQDMNLPLFRHTDNMPNLRSGRYISCPDAERFK